MKNLLHITLLTMFFSTISFSADLGDIGASIISAINDKQFDEAEKLIKENQGLEINDIKDGYGCNLLKLAAGLKLNEDEQLINKQLKLVNLLISKGVKVNAVDAIFSTPLIAAVGRKNLALIKLLIENGADINYKSNSNETVLHMSARRSLTKIIILLLDNNADVNIADWCGRTPLLMAALAKKPEIVLLLLANGSITDNLPENIDTAISTIIEKYKIIINMAKDKNIKLPHEVRQECIKFLNNSIPIDTKWHSDFPEEIFINISSNFDFITLIKLSTTSQRVYIIANMMIKERDLHKAITVDIIKDFAKKNFNMDLID